MSHRPCRKLIHTVIEITLAAGRLPTCLYPNFEMRCRRLFQTINLFAPSEPPLILLFSNGRTLLQVPSDRQEAIYEAHLRSLVL